MPKSVDHVVHFSVTNSHTDFGTNVRNLSQVVIVFIKAQLDFGGLGHSAVYARARKLDRFKLTDVKRDARSPAVRIHDRIPLFLELQACAQEQLVKFARYVAPVNFAPVFEVLFNVIDDQMAIFHAILILFEALIECDEISCVGGLFQIFEHFGGRGILRHEFINLAIKIFACSLVSGLGSLR